MDATFTLRLARLKMGNPHAGSGTRSLKGTDVSYMRSDDGARLFFRTVEGGYEVVGKASKGNEQPVINILEDFMVRIVTERGDIIRIIDTIEDPIQDNVDAAVRTYDGHEYIATFYTIQNVLHLFDKYAQSGECAGGVYLWGSDMILVKQLSPEVIRATVIDLIASERFTKAFSCIDREMVGHIDLHQPTHLKSPNRPH